MLRGQGRSSRSHFLRNFFSRFDRLPPLGASLARPLLSEARSSVRSAPTAFLDQDEDPTSRTSH